MIKNSIIFTFFELFNKAIPFLLLPILTRFLSPSDYGIIASFTAFVSFIGIFIGLSAHGAVDANYFRLAKKQLSIYISNVLLVLVGTFIVLICIILLFNDLIFLKLNLSLEWQIIAALVALSQFITLMNLSLWVIEGKAKEYGFYQLSQTIMITFISILLIVGFHYKWDGQLLGIALGTIVFSVLTLSILKKRGYLNIKINEGYIKDYLAFGIPMIPHQLGGWIRTQGDKFLLLAFIGTSATGLFSVGQQIAMIMSILVASLNKALYPILFKSLNNKLDMDGKQQIVKITYILAFFVLLLGFILILFVTFFYPYLLGKEFQNSLLLTQLIIFAFIFEGLYYLVVNYIFYFKKTAQLAKVTFIISIFHVTVSIIFIQLFGVIGVAYTLVISSFIQFVAIWYLSNKIFPMPWFNFLKKGTDAY